MVQLTFEMLEIESPQFFEPSNDQIKIGDMVIIKKNNLDSEALNYFEYYHPEMLKAPGVVVKVLKDTLIVIYKSGEEIEIEKSNVKIEG